MKRISDKEKKIRGTFQPCRSLRNASKAWNPYKDIKAVPVPENLPEYALQVWQSTATELIEMEVLTPLDLSMLQAYAYCCHLCNEFQQKLNEGGYTHTITNARGHSYETASPYVQMLKEQTALCNRLAASFGLAPGLRSRVPVEPKADPKANPFDGWEQF
jgi:P27 family predicted phage terminase small subunit